MQLHQVSFAYETVTHRYREKLGSDRENTGNLKGKFECVSIVL